jgi:hypothetical protein
MDRTGAGLIWTDLRGICQELPCWKLKMNEEDSIFRHTTVPCNWSPISILRILIREFVCELCEPLYPELRLSIWCTPYS